MIDERKCSSCGKVLIRHDGEFLSHFVRRMTCGPECRSAQISTSSRARGGSRDQRKTCLVCKGQFAPREDEPVSSFLRRKTCSKQCLHLRKRLPKLQQAPPRTCEWCGEVIHQRVHETRGNYLRRRTCDGACGRKLTASRKAGTRVVCIPLKWCEACGVPLQIRSDERMGPYRARRSCSRKCADLLATRSKVSQGDRDRLYPLQWNEKFKWVIRERDGFVCQECGEVEEGRAHHVHHIDYDKQNLDPINLITLCPSCHGRTCNPKRHSFYVERYQAVMRGEIAA